MTPLPPDALGRALGYPYPAPAGSYLFSDGRKYPGAAKIPVEAAWLDGFDTVYAARISGYGAVPATIAPCPGCRVAVKVLWLSLDQLPAMHASEAIGVGYDFGVLEAPLICHHSGLLPRALVYIARSGAFAPEGEPLALAEIAAEQRRWRSASQPAIQERMRSALEPAMPLDAFLAAQIGRRELRLERAAWLAKTALPWHHSRFRALTAEDPL